MSRMGLTRQGAVPFFRCQLREAQLLQVGLVRHIACKYSHFNTVNLVRPVTHFKLSFSRHSNLRPTVQPTGLQRQLKDNIFNIVFSCRNLHYRKRPWCYVWKRLQLVWEYCEIPHCGFGSRNFILSLLSSKKILCMLLQSKITASLIF